MPELKVSAQLLQQLLALRGMARIVDEQGNLVGTFHPVSRPPYDDIEVPPMTREQIEEAKTTPGRPLSEVVRDLRQRP